MITLIYLTIGLWLTTALVEQLADVFRLVHYAGRQVNNIKGVNRLFKFNSYFFLDYCLARRSSYEFGRFDSDGLP